MSQEYQSHEHDERHGAQEQQRQAPDAAHEQHAPSPEDYRATLEELDALRADRERLLRTAADSQNLARKAREEIDEARRQAVTGVVRDVILSLDHFDMALSHDPEKATAHQVIEGVRSIRDELLRVLTRHGIGLVDPEAGEPFDPQRHEALAHRSAEGIPPGHVVETFQIGYTLGDRVVRPAKVAVAADQATPPAQESR